MKKLTAYAIACCLIAPCVFAKPAQVPASSVREDAILHQVRLLNQIPEDQLSDRNDPGFSIIKTIYDEDAPDFLTLRKVLGKARVRASLTPSAKAVLAEIISQRWDTFTLSGNLWLSALQSPNAELRDKARQHLVAFIQKPHIPVLIDLLRKPGANQPAYEILREVTGQSIEPTPKKWQSWWAKASRKADLVGHVLKDTRMQILQQHIAGFDQERFWYLPDDVKKANQGYSSRPLAEQTLVTRWSEWVEADVKQYVDEWSLVKPILDRLIHQPDPRVNKFFEQLLEDPGMGDYAAIVLAWRGGEASLPAIQAAYQRFPTVGRALGRGSLGDKMALRDLLGLIEKKGAPLSFYMMDDNARSYAKTLHTVGVISAEQSFELLAHHVCDFRDVDTRREKKKAIKKAKQWLDKNWDKLTFDRRRRYFVLPQESSR
ncbi:MAG: hypothetical protein WC859_04595 [Elusimicrobiota bacterium]|jgi:hypothetical protein